MIDRMLRAEITATVNKAMTDILTSIEEKWVSEKELSNQISFLSKDWLETYGNKLPRERNRIVDAVTGDVIRETRFSYPLHKIQLMIARGELREIEWEAKMKKDSAGELASRNENCLTI